MTRFRIWAVLGSACVLFTLAVVATGIAATGKPRPSSYDSDPRSGAALNREAALNPAPSPQRLYPEDPRQRITNAQAVNNPSADTTAQDTQSETSVAVLGSKVMVAFNDSGSYASGGNQFTGYATSADGGTSFVDHGALPSSALGDIGDPVLAKDSSTGAIYLATPAFKPDDTVQVFKSIDGGQSFGPPVNGTPGSRSVDSQDKEWMTVDNFAGAGRHNVYLC